MAKPKGIALKDRKFANAESEEREINALPKISEVRLRDLIPSAEFIYHSSKTPICLWSPPGLGKSKILEALADKLQLQYCFVVLTYHESVDFRGAPTIETTVTLNSDGHPVHTKWTKFCQTDLLPTEPCLIVFEELGNCPEDVKLVLQRIIHDRNLDNGWAAHPESFMAVTSNLIEDNCGVTPIPASLDNRMINMLLLADPEAWINWFTGAYNGDSASREAASIVASYIDFRPSHAHRFNGDDMYENRQGWPSYRTWESVIKSLSYAIRNRIDLTDKRVVIAILGSIGVYAGNKFYDFLRIREKLVGVNEMLAGSWTWPNEPDIRSAFIGSLAEKAQPQHFKRIKEIMDQLSKEQCEDYAMLLCRLCAKLNEEFRDSEEYEDFCFENRDLLLT